MPAQTRDIQTQPRYGILGGTFDPPHMGHLVLAQEAYARLGLDRVWFVPAGAPPHKSGHTISAVDHRRAMVERAIAGDARFALCAIELERAGPSYTSDTLGLLRERWGAAAEICLIVGWDMLISLPTWHDAAGVVAKADRLVAAHRPGVAVDERELEHVEAELPGVREKLRLITAPQLDLAATAIRERVALALPIRYLVPEGVRHYIERHALYRAPSGTPETAKHAKGETP
ncbi:MAG: nicotinate (nicotinamide) nucleotide adenylyltransferase [Ktedonobacterales bacterium]|nr:nicotinate (nicotinamide) nucleotide adenylyltransferase [Ktedonobacterales bacterium]